jgi:predicted ferric reductase
MKSKLSLFIIWFIVLLSGPVAVLKIVKGFEITQNIPLLINILQRIIGLLAFSLLFMQIILGAFMQKWIEKLGTWVLKFHIIQGVIVYILILAHPFLFVIYNFKIRGLIDPFYVFTDICLLCPRSYELYYSFGRIAFWLMSFAILAAIIKSEVWWRENWRKFHILNYFAFFLIAAHAWFLGTDIASTSFIYVFWFGIIAVIYTILRKYILPLIINK